MVKAAELDRLDLEDAYDPGGLHRTRFHELWNGDLLLIYELGIARLTVSGEVTWHSTHDQLTAHFDGVTDDAVWFLGEDDRFGFALSTGRPVVA